MAQQIKALDFIERLLVGRLWMLDMRTLYMDYLLDTALDNLTVSYDLYRQTVLAAINIVQCKLSGSAGGTVGLTVNH